MKPKEKAVEILEKMTKRNVSKEASRSCALIMIDEILSNIIQGYHTNEYGTYNYWKEVQANINII